jgi:hypothetical protein
MMTPGSVSLTVAALLQAGATVKQRDVAAREWEGRAPDANRGVAHYEPGNMLRRSTFFG